MNPYSIFLVEDHAGFANALNNMLSQNQNLQIVAVAGTAEEALEQVGNLKIDLALIDFSLPDMTGLNLLERLHHEHPDMWCAIPSGSVAPFGMAPPNTRTCGVRSFRGIFCPSMPAVHWIWGRAAI